MPDKKTPSVVATCPPEMAAWIDPNGALQAAGLLRVELGGMPAGFAAIYKKAEELKWPEHYVTDLLHDQKSITERPDAMFLWCVRQCGTHLLFEPTNEQETLWGDAVLTSGLVRQRYFYWNGSSLIERDSAQAMGIFRGWVRRLAVRSRPVPANVVEQRLDAAHGAAGKLLDVLA